MTPRNGGGDIPPVSVDAARAKFQSYLTEKGLRVTNQRLAIFDAAFARKEHFTAEDLLEEARKIDDSVSRATVYRTLPIMTESALLREVEALCSRLERMDEKQLDAYLLPHPLLGKLTLREMLYFTIYHVEHHGRLVAAQQAGGWG